MRVPPLLAPITALQLQHVPQEVVLGGRVAALYNHFRTALQSGLERKLTVVVVGCCHWEENKKTSNVGGW